MGVRDDRLAVVISPLTTAYNEEERLHAARFAEMGLTSFGDNPEQAVRRLKKLFNTFINSHRSLGVLEETLNRLGVKWYWADEYPEEGPAYENTNAMVALTVDSQEVLKSAREQGSVWAVPSNSELVAAA